MLANKRSAVMALAAAIALSGHLTAASAQAPTPPRMIPHFEVDPQLGARFPGIAQNNLQAVNVGGARTYKYVPAYNTNFRSPAGAEKRNSRERRTGRYRRAGAQWRRAGAWTGRPQPSSRGC